MMTHDQLRQHRRWLKLSKQAFSTILGVPYKTYEKWESGDRSMSVMVQEYLEKRIKVLVAMKNKSSLSS